MKHIRCAGPRQRAHRVRSSNAIHIMQMQEAHNGLVFGLHGSFIVEFQRLCYAVAQMRYERAVDAVVANVVETSAFRMGASCMHGHQSSHVLAQRCPARLTRSDVGYSLRLSEVRARERSSRHTPNLSRVRSTVSRSSRKFPDPAIGPRRHEQRPNAMCSEITKSEGLTERDWSGNLASSASRVRSTHRAPA